MTTRMLAQRILIVVIAGVLLLLAALLHGGIYTVRSAGGRGGSMLYVVNRYTGTVVACDVGDVSELRRLRKILAEIRAAPMEDDRKRRAITRLEAEMVQMASCTRP